MDSKRAGAGALREALRRGNLEKIPDSNRFHCFAASAGEAFLTFSETIDVLLFEK